MNNRDLFVALPGTDWHEKALCARAPGRLREQFVRSEYNSRKDAENKDFQDALALCRRCPVRNQCREWNDEVENCSTSPATMGSLFAGETPVKRAERRRRRNDKRRK